MKSSMLCLVTVLVFSLVGFGLASGALPEGLVFLMTFDEGSGEDVHDLSGYGNNGVVVGKTDWVDGKYGKAFNFDGATHITVQNAEPLGKLTHPMSVGLWINPTVVGGWRSILEMDGPTGWKIGLHNGTDAVVWTTYFVKDFVAATPVEVDRWTHIAATWDGAEALIYVDGVLDATVPGGGVIDVSDVPTLDLGYRSSSSASWYEGAVDEAFVFNRLIDENELTKYVNGFGDILAVEPGRKLTTMWGSMKDSK
jgi:hypothetical protein